MFDLNPVQMMIIGAIAVLLFGDRLPEVSRKVGKHILDFKKNIRGIQDQITSAVYSQGSSHSSDASDGYSSMADNELHEEATAPKFEPPPPPSKPAAIQEPSGTRGA